MSNDYDRQLAHDRLAGTFDQLMNPYDIERRLEILIDEFLQDVDLEGQTVLDAGCGTGRGTQRLAERGARVVAFDLGIHLLEVARRRCACEPICGSVTSLPFGDGTFSVVFSSEVIEHTPDPRAAVLEMVRVLKPGGRLVLSTPNWLWQIPVRIASSLKLRPYDGIENFLRPGELREVLESTTGQLVHHKGLHLIPFQITPLHGLSRYLDRFGDAWLPLMINQCVSYTKRE